MAADFYRSSHGNYWLVDRKTLVNARALDLKYASPQEIAWIAVWSANAIHKLAKRLSLRQQVTATAIIYLRRFYLKNSYCETDVPLVAAACVYVAAKAEETAMHIKVIVTEARATFSEYGITTFPSDSTKLAEMEFYLIEDLEFHLIVYHPYRSLVHMTGRDSGPIAVRETMLEMDDNSMQMAWFVLNDTYRTELCLLYPPHIIAIASMYIAFALHAPASIFGPPKSAVTAPAASSGESSTAPSTHNTPEAGRHTLAPTLHTASSAMKSGSTLPAPSPSLPAKPQMHSQTQAAAPVPSPAAAGPSHPPRGKVDPVTWLASLNVQFPIVFEVVQEILSLYPLWKSYEETPTASSGGPGTDTGAGTGTGAGGPGERTPGETAQRNAIAAVMGIGLSNPGAAPGAGDERVIQILGRMRANREMDLAHPANAGQPAK